MNDDLRTLRDSIINSDLLGAVGSLAKRLLLVGFMGCCCWEIGRESVEFLRWWVVRL